MKELKKHNIKNKKIYNKQKLFKENYNIINKNFVKQNNYKIKLSLKINLFLFWFFFL